MRSVNGFNGFDGFKQRAMLTENGQKCMFIGPLFLSIAMQDRFLLPLCSLEFVFTLAHPEFVLRVNTATDRNYKYVIDNFKILLNRVRVTPTVASRIEERLQKSPALYPVRMCSCRVFNVPERAKVYECQPFGQVCFADVRISVVKKWIFSHSIFSNVFHSKTGCDDDSESSLYRNHSYGLCTRVKSSLTIFVFPQ